MCIRFYFLINMGSNYCNVKVVAASDKPTEKHDSLFWFNLVALIHFVSSSYFLINILYLSYLSRTKHGRSEKLIVEYSETYWALISCAWSTKIEPFVAKKQDNLKNRFAKVFNCCSLAAG